MGFSIENVRCSGNYNDGLYTIINVHKYIGKEKQIKCRSSYEKQMCKILDLEPTVTRWTSECDQLKIPYTSQIDGNTKHRSYFPDYYAEILKNGVLSKIVFEVKPEKFIIEPKKPKPPLTKKAKDRYISDMRRYILIMDKRKAALEWCKDRGFTYQFITERFLFR